MESSPAAVAAIFATVDMDIALADSASCGTVWILAKLGVRVHGVSLCRHTQTVPDESSFFKPRRSEFLSLHIQMG